MMAGWRAAGFAARLALPVLALLALAAAGCESPSSPDGSQEFVVDVSGERFVVRLTDPDAIRLAGENLQGANARFPMGTVRRGDGGFNQPWSWHLDPDDTTLVELAIEVCDGRPSYLEGHLDDYTTYCPWGARIVGRR